MFTTLYGAMKLTKLEEHETILSIKKVKRWDKIDKYDKPYSIVICVSNVHELNALIFFPFRKFYLVYKQT